jgi:hypothetical protein
VKQCTTPGCGEYCDAVSSSSQTCTRCSSALASEAEYFVINPTAVLSSTLSQGLQVQPPTRQMLVMTAMKFSETEQLGQQSSTMLKYFPFWPITDNAELNKAKQLGLGAVSGSHSLKHIKSLQQRIETVIKGIDGTANAKYQIMKYLDSGGLTSRVDRYDQQRHLLQALVDSDLMDLFAAAMRGKLLIMDDSNDQNSSQSSMSSVRTRHLVGDLILVPNMFEKCQPTVLHEFIKDQENLNTTTTGVVTIDPQVFHLLEPFAHQLVEKLLPSEFLSKLAVRHKDSELGRGHMSFIRLITHVYGNVRHHPAVTAAKDRAEMNAKLSEPMKPHETSKALEDRYIYCLNKYNFFSDTKRFSDTEGGKAEQCELIMSLLEFNLKSTVMSEFDAVRHKAERKQKSPPEMA